MKQLRRPACDLGWKTEASVRTIAGAMIVTSLGLSLLDKRWLLLTAFVGVNLFQSGLSGWCLLSNVLTLKRGRASQ